jgi:hypothetical protein
MPDPATADPAIPTPLPGPEPVPPAIAAPAPPAAGEELLAALGESQAAFARGLAALGDQMAGIARSGLDVATDAATRFLGARTWSDAIEINAALARNSFDALFGGGAKLSELGVKLAAETSQPILAHWGDAYWRNPPWGSPDWSHPHWPRTGAKAPGEH